MPYSRKCHECGKEFRSRQYNADFCGTPCRRKFNNRRAVRGATLYDLLMIQFCDPDAFEKCKLDGRLTLLIEKWRKEDEDKRSWKRPSEVMYDTPSI